MRIEEAMAQYGQPGWQKGKTRRALGINRTRGGQVAEALVFDVAEFTDDSLRRERSSVWLHQYVAVLPESVVAEKIAIAFGGIRDEAGLNKLLLEIL